MHERWQNHDYVFGPNTVRAADSALFDIIASTSAGMDLQLGGGNPYETSVYVFAAIGNIAQAIAGLPLRLFTAGDDPVWEHEYLTLMQQPNPEQTGEELIEAFQTHKEIDGYAFLIEPEFELGSSRAAARREIYVASASEMEPIEVAGELVAWRYTPLDGARNRTLTLSQVMPSRHYHPRKRLEGLSGARVARLAIEGHYGALNLFRNAVRNGAELGAVFTTDKDLSEQQHDAQMKVIRTRYSGPVNANKPLLLSGGVKVDRGSQGMNDINWLQGMGVAATIIATAYRVPPLFVNLMDQAQYNSAPVQMSLFWTMNGLPQKRRVEAALNRIVLRGDQAKYQFRLDTSDVQVLKLEQAEFMERVFKLTQYQIARNEINDRFDLGFENPDFGKVPLVPAGLLPADVLFDEAESSLGMGKTPEGVNPADPGTDPGADDPGADDPNADPAADPPAGSPAGSTASGKAIDALLIRVCDEAREIDTVMRAAAQMKALHAKWFRSWKGLRSATQLAVRKYFQRQAREVVARLRQEAPGIPELAALANDKGLAELVARAIECGDEGVFDAAVGTESAQRIDPIQIDRILFDLVAENGKLRAILKPKIEDAAELGGKQIADEIDGPFDFNIDDPAIKQHVEQQIIRVQRINATTRARVRRALLKGLDSGETLTDVADRISKAMGGNNPARSYVIAQTELHEAINVGRRQSIDQAGLGKSWLTSGLPVRTKSNPNGIVRLAHKGAERYSAKGIPAVEDFTLTDEDGFTELAAQPGDARLSAGNKINCACTVVARTLTKGGGQLIGRVGEFTYERMLGERGHAE